MKGSLQREGIAKIWKKMEMKMIMTTSNNCLNLSREKSKRVRLLAGKDGFLFCFLERQQADARIRR